MNEATRELREAIYFQTHRIYTREIKSMDGGNLILKLLKDRELKFVSNKLPTNEYIGRDFEPLIEEIDIE